MSVIDSAKNKLGELWYRIRAWAHSVPPDVWIGLAIAFVTLIVVYLAYRKAGSSSSDGLSTSNPIVGTSGTPGTSSLTSQPLTSSDVVSPGMFDISQLWTRPASAVSGNPASGNPPVGRVPSTLKEIFQSATTRDESVTAKYSSNTNSVYADNAKAAALASQMQNGANLVQQQYDLYQQQSAAPDESVIAKVLQAIKPAATPKPAAIIRPSPFAINPKGPTGRGVDISLN